MDGFNTAPHISGRFDEELESIHTKIVAMGHLVEQQLSLAIKAFTTGNVDLAMQVLKQDDLVDEYETIIDAECVSTIALRQPTGSDLSLLVAIIKATGELEGIAAKAEGIADITIQLKKMLPADTKQEIDSNGQ
ncbi:MAG: PhoU domain-containing protein [Methylococcales bacterium]|nr:PhoU domain-containing protein [Methylococcales bacterium]MDD5754701.1 PhoU domain-containing protein [Methylococcales bacterium]